MEVQYTSYDTHETISIRDIMPGPGLQKNGGYPKNTQKWQPETCLWGK